MRNLKHIIMLILTTLFIIESCLCVAASEPAFDVTKTQATVTDAPQNSSMIVALYDGNRISDMRIYEGSGTITASYADDMSDSLKKSDNIKVFLWNFESLSPLASAYCNNLSDLTDKQINRVLTVYFSATGNTERLAQKIAAETNSDVFEIVPEEPYTSADLNYSNSDCRANKEQNDPTARPAISSTLENLEDYDVIFIGYPIWWGTMPKIINTFLDTYDLSDKTIMPFCTSGSCGISSSVSAIKSACPNADVKTGFRGTSGTTSTQIRTWLTDNNFSDAIIRK